MSTSYVECRLLCIDSVTYGCLNVVACFYNLQIESVFYLKLSFALIVLDYDIGEKPKSAMLFCYPSNHKIYDLQGEH